RVGGAAQTRAMRSVAGSLRLDLSQYRELQAFAQFGTDDLDAATRQQLERGQRLTEVLKQPQYEPLSLAEQVTILYAGVNGYMDDVPVEKVADFERGFHDHMRASGSDVLQAITDSGELDESTEESLKKAIDDFKGSVAY
ncbi:MAG: F0F1 ATP synthase subunit alpha, partial [Dehalococcoidia bacterium]|nr:F0F1 ATP synthase subunit alpha [Dehalococcoidia bacterium]